MATVEKRGKSYRITVSDGYDTKGNQLRFRKTWTPQPGMTESQIKKALEKEKVLFEIEVKSGNGGVSTKLAEYIEYWLEKHVKVKLRPYTYERYSTHAKRVNAALGHIKLEKLTPKHLMDFYETLSKDGANQITKGPLAPKTIKEIHHFISSALSKAVQWKFIKDNVAQLVDAPTSPDKEAVCLTADQAIMFINRIHREKLKYEVYFMILLLTGMRRGEALGLEWQDIDFKNNTITIERISIHSKKLGFRVGAPKTQRSNRRLSIPKELVDLLRIYKMHQQSERLLKGDDWDPEWDEHPRLFVQLSGKPMYPNCPYKRMKAIVKELGLPKGTNLHSLRHTHATLLITNNTDPSTVSGRLGHAKTSTTMNIYAHYLKPADEIAADVAADILIRGNAGKTG